MNKIKVITWKGYWTREDAVKNPDKLFLFGDNIVDSLHNYIPNSTQAVIRGLPNAIGISTKYDRNTKKLSYFNNEDLEDFKHQLTIISKKIDIAIVSGKYTCIVLPENGIGTGKAKLQQKAPLLFEHLNNWLEQLKNNLK